MDPNLQLIFGFILAITTLAFGIGYILTRREQEHKERKLALQTRLEEAKATQAEAAVVDYRRFEERLRVLERIATDGNHALASQIDQLRDLHEIEDLTKPRERAQ